MRSGRRSWLAVAGTLCFLALLLVPAGAGAVDLPDGFQDTTVFSDVEEPTAIRFAADGRAFVAQKSGVILVYSDLSNSTPAVFADLSAKVYGAGDRGLLGLALDPQFPQRPYVYALYTYDHQLGEAGEGPRWNDGCPTPPGFETNGCVVSGRLVKLTAAGDHSSGEQVLIEGWCQQFPSHSIGALQFDSAGALYVSAGDGAGYNAADYGQFGYPEKNPCGDPPAGVGGTQSPPSAEGGGLRSQDLRTPAPADPTGLSGAVLRIDPDTGAGLPGNPLAASFDQNERRIVAYGFRNPFRFAINPETNEVYVGNVGAEAYEEIDRFNPASGVLFNSGWPCLEGPEANLAYASLGLSICDGLYADASATAQAFFYYGHYGGIVPEDPCSHSNGNALSGMAFYDGDAFPAPYEGALFFADSVRGCIYVMFAGPDGRPDPSTLVPFASDAGLYPGIDIEVGPEGNLFYTSLFGPEFSAGSVHRISYFSGNQPPVAHLAVDKAWSPGPLDATFDAAGSTDSDGDPLTYEWDLEGDGSFESPSSASVKSRSFDDEENHTVAVRVRDPDGAESIDRITVYPADTPPEAIVVEPGSAFEWSVGEPISFEGEAWDEEDGVLATTNLDWSTRLFHCPAGCHAHPLQAFPAIASGSFPAPDHEYPSHIQLKLTATDSRGLSAWQTVDIYPKTVQLIVTASTPGLLVGVGLENRPGPLRSDRNRGFERPVGGPGHAAAGRANLRVGGLVGRGRARAHRPRRRPGCLRSLLLHARGPGTVGRRVCADADDPTLRRGAADAASGSPQEERGRPGGEVRLFFRPSGQPLPLQARSPAAAELSLAEVVSASGGRQPSLHGCRVRSRFGRRRSHPGGLPLVDRALGRQRLAWPWRRALPGATRRRPGCARRAAAGGRRGR